MTAEEKNILKHVSGVLPLSSAPPVPAKRNFVFSSGKTEGETTVKRRVRVARKRTRFNRRNSCGRARLRPVKADWSERRLTIPYT